MKKNTIAVIISWIWISISEFLRNEFLLKKFWTEHYENMGQTFPSKPLNGAVWGIWALVFALLIVILSKKFNLIQTFWIAWITGFIMMWLVIGNLNVLPWRILPYAIPLSLLEAFVSSWLVHRIISTEQGPKHID